MSSTVRLSSKLSKDEETNGLDSLAGDLLANPGRVVCALVWLTVDKITEDVEHGGVRVPSVRVKRIEPIATVDKVPEQVVELALKLNTERTGKTPLPFDVTETVEGGYVNGPVTEE